MTTSGHWKGLYNKASGLLLVHYYDRDDRVGQKYVLSKAHVRKMMKPPKAQIPAYHDYKARFAGADKFYKGLYHCTWPHKHGGRGLLGDSGHQHNFAVSGDLQNMFNAFVHVNRLPSTSFSFSEHCLILADEIYYYATNMAA